MYTLWFRGNIILYTRYTNAARVTTRIDERVFLKIQRKFRHSSPLFRQSHNILISQQTDLPARTPFKECLPIYKCPIHNVIWVHPFNDILLFTVYTIHHLRSSPSSSSSSISSPRSALSTAFDDHNAAYIILLLWLSFSPTPKVNYNNNNDHNNG